jgi:AraC-like DNA-binding protein
VLLNETIERFRPLAQEQNIRMVYHAQVDTYPVVIDREMIAKILSNLLSNALKYAHDSIDIYLELPDEAASLLEIRFTFKPHLAGERIKTDKPEGDTFRPSITINSADEQFMKKLHAILLERLFDSLLSVEVLASMMNMSTSTLYRKLKSIADLGPSEYIRLYRLKKAAEMLNRGEHRINEISYLTGFSSPSYFTASFRKQFNISPSDFIKQKKKH